MSISIRLVPGILVSSATPRRRIARAPPNHTAAVFTLVDDSIVEESELHARGDVNIRPVIRQQFRGHQECSRISFTTRRVDIALPTISVQLVWSCPTLPMTNGDKV